jgi:hypothetical protein
MHKKYRELIEKAVSVDALLDLMTNTAQFEQVKTADKIRR